MSSRIRIPILLLVVLLLPGCAVGEEPTSSTESGLQPRLAPEKKKAARPRADRRSGKGRSVHRNDPPRGGVTPSGGKDDEASEPDGSPTGSGPSRPPSPVATGAEQASVSDPTGDADGLGVPAYADLTGAVLTREPGRYSLRVGAAAAYPTRSEEVMHVICFVDVDGDGSIDHELWGTLADNGWSGTWRYPEGARFGADSGVSVRPEGRDLVFAFGPSRVGGATSFRWLVGAEHGTFEQQASGTMSQDYAPDSGAARFPG